LKYPNNIRRKREGKCLTQQQLAIAIGMSRSFLGQIELGLVKVPEKYIEKLCIVLDAGIEELLGNENRVEKIDDAAIQLAIELIDSAVDATDLTENQRMDLVKQAYKMVKEAVEKKLTNNQLEEEINLLKKNIENELSLVKEQRKNIFNFLKKSSN